MTFNNSWHASGTASINNAETTLTGQSSTWLTSGIRAGDYFLAEGRLAAISAVNSNTSITLADPWPGATRTAQSYKIIPASDAVRVLVAARTVLDLLDSGNISALAGLTSAADTLPYFTGSGAAALTTFTSFMRTLLDDTSAPAALSTLMTEGANIASATTTSIGAATGWFVTVTGTATITSLGASTAGTPRIVAFSGAATLTHNATTLILPGGDNIVTAAGDVAIFVSEGSSAWRCVHYQRASGLPLHGGLAFDAAGLVADLSDYDAEATGFTYLATDTGAFYVKLSATSADWSAAMPLRGPQGEAAPAVDPLVATIQDTDGIGAGIYVITDAHPGAKTYERLVAKRRLGTGSTVFYVTVDGSPVTSSIPLTDEQVTSTGLSLEIVDGQEVAVVIESAAATVLYVAVQLDGGA